MPPLSPAIEQMFVDFLAADLEEAVAMYPFHRSLQPEGCSFNDYVKLRVSSPDKLPTSR
jgi:hypothetical protein